MLHTIVLAAVASALALTALMWLAPRLGWLDRPDPRKPHLAPVPPVGGAAWLLGLFVVLSYSGLLMHMHLLAAALLLMLLTGLLDDLRPMSSWLRLALQIVIATALVIEGDAVLHSLGALLPGVTAVQLGLLSLPVTVFALVGVINAVNMADGMDGLAGSYLLICLLAIATLHASSSSSGGGVDLQLALLAGAALVPFLLLNLRLPWQGRARVFLGDAGSMSAGLLVGVLLIRGSQGEQAAFAPTVALWLLAVPLIDTVSVMLRRVAAGRSPFTPDQQHVHHVLLRAGLSVGRTWQILAAVATLMALGGALGHWLGLPQTGQFLMFMLLASSYHLWVCRVLRQGCALGRALRPGLSHI